MADRLSFFGGAGTVTGSKFLLESGGRKVLIDCGLFQGYKQLRQRNWAPLPFDPVEIDAVVLTHAHIDHSGYIPLLVKNGFAGKVFCTEATLDLCEILLPDSGYLQEREADFANRYGYSKHKPALPLYGLKDAQDSLAAFAPHPFAQSIEIFPGLNIKFMRAGHILGAAIVECTFNGKQVVFSGDLGRPDMVTMVNPDIVEKADCLVIESTYGDRRHDDRDTEDAIEEIILRTVRRGGTVIIPSFAVGRAQTLLFHIHRLKVANRIPDMPVFLDSPMAINATEIFKNNREHHKLTKTMCDLAFKSSHYVRTSEESKALDTNPMPKIIISASGMATGGRVVHHLKSYLSDNRNTILFAGFQAGGTRGEALINGANRVKIHGEYFEVSAEISNLEMLSAHADSDEIMSWLHNFRKPPKCTFIVHGEPAASDALQDRIEEELDWDCIVPEQLSTHPLH
ncbi:MAG: MBL fold metallo-hydrolase [Acidimicrobiales bacterium]|nr:MAG: MBL fold metallo-hydrolase [Acidimicrobiales bacterium]